MINYKKIATLIGSALMVGSTIGVAAAAAMPSPFVESGVANVAVVYGGDADVAAASNIQSYLATKVAAGGVSGNVTITGEAYKIEKASTKFQYGQGITNLESSLDDKDLPILLADGTFMDNDNDEFDYKQTLDLANLTLGLFDDDEYKRDAPTVGFDVSEGTYVMNATLDFIDTPVFGDLETTDLPLLGKTYYVLDVATANNTITLLDAAESQTLGEGDTATLTVDGKTYEVQVDFISSTPNVKFIVNGETTNSLGNSATQRLKDGAYIGVKEVLYTSKDSGKSKVEFSIGSGKLKIVSGDEVELNDESIDNLIGYIVPASGDSGKLDKVALQWSAEQDSWIAPDSSIEMPGFKAVKMSFTGMTYPAEEEIKVQADGDDNIVLSNFPLANGVTETINLLQSNNTRFTVIGKDSNNKIADSANGTSLVYTKNEDDYFAVTYRSGEDAESYLVKATNWNEDDTDPADNEVDFEYLTSNGWKALDSAVTAGEDVEVGDATFRVNSISNESSSATVTITAGTNTKFNQLVSAEGLTVYLPWENTTAINVYNATQFSSNASACAAATAMQTPGTFSSGYNGIVYYNRTVTNASYPAACTFYPATYQLNFTEEDKDDNSQLGSNLSVTFGLDSQSEVYVTAITGAGTAYEIGESDVYRSFVTSALNTEILDDQSGDHEKVTLKYHGGESYGNLYVMAPSASASGDGSALGVLTVTDAEVSTVSSKNLIVVGGSCINDVAAKILNSDSPICGSDFTAKTNVGAGQYLISTVASPYATGKVAMLVAGYDARETLKASIDLKNNADKFEAVAGYKYIGSSTLLGDRIIA